MESVDEPSLDQASKASTLAADPSMGLKRLWKTSLLVQGRVDSRRGLIEGAEGQKIGICLLDLATQMLGGDDLKFAQALLIRGASLKSKKQQQKLFPSRILNKCLFKSRGGALRTLQGYGEEMASYAMPDSAERGSGTRQFGKELAEHLQDLKQRFSEKPGKDEAKAIEELALYSLAHVIVVFKDEVRQVARESKPFEVAARAVGRAYEKGFEEGFDGGKDHAVQAYCGSVLRRLEILEKLGSSKSTKIFNKYLATWDRKKIGISLDKIIGNHPLGSFPELHHLPMGEFLTLAGGDAESETKPFLKLLSDVSDELTLGARELARFDALTNLYFSQEFQIKEDEIRMEPVEHGVATRPLMSAYRQVKDHLNGIGILKSPCCHFFGWYSIPRVTEAFWIGQCEKLTLSGCLPIGMKEDPWSEALSDLRMEYSLAKVQRNFYEPPLSSVIPSAFVLLNWEIESLGVSRDSIRIEAADESLGMLSLSFEYANSENEKPLRREMIYKNADISMSHPSGLLLPPETAPILFQSPEELPVALLFIGENVVKELPLYHRYSYGKNVALYILESKVATKIRKERRKPSEKPSKKLTQSEYEKPIKPAEPELAGMPKMASGLLKADKDLKILQGDLAWTKDVLEKILAEQKVAGKSRRIFRRLHRQLEHRATRGYSNRLEGEFMKNLATLSRQFDSEADAS